MLFEPFEKSKHLLLFFGNFAKDNDNMLDVNSHLHY